MPRKGPQKKPIRIQMTGLLMPSANENLRARDVTEQYRIADIDQVFPFESLDDGMR
jgi:hypothetical protein